ncbi:hypothetical protein MBLNU459_g8190t1 [Dothideomycetes sp. NU459]
MPAASETVDVPSTAPASNTTSATAPAPAPTSEAAATQKPDNAQKKEKAAPKVDSAQLNGESKLSGKELKERAKREKAERRAKEKAEKTGGPEGPSPPAGPAGAKGSRGAQAEGSKQQRQGEQSQKGGQAQQKKALPQGAGPHALPVRGSKQIPAGAVKEPRRGTKEVGLFGHLYSQPKKYTIENVSKEVHPAVLALGLQMSSYVICGSNARCVAMLLAFKKAIQSYTTPLNTSLARHLTSHYLSPQIDYLKSHRPISVSMGNAIRWLKDYIIQIDPDTPESTAKSDICAAIDIFIRERVTVADTAIAATACAKIRNGSTIVTFAKSSIVEKTLVQAHSQGIKFKVIVVDSRPLFEGKNLARNLARAGITTSYMLTSAASHALKDADLVLLGAHAMMANGRLYSRVGTAAVAMLAHKRDVPVIVCCESIKFTDRVALDSIVLNEIAPPDELVLPSEFESTKDARAEEEKPKDGNKKDKGEKAETAKDVPTLAKWRDVQNLQLLNILYDVTPAEYINMVITEYGSLPPSSVPVVHRISTERDVRA